MSARVLTLLVILASLLVSCGQQSKPQQLRILTYNIHHGQGTDGKFDLQRIANVINAFEPDLVALQEVDRKTKRASGVDQAAELARLTGMNYAYGPAMEYSGGEYGEAILSRFPLVSIDNYILPWGDGSEPRALLVVQVKTNDFGMLVFGGTHLAHDSQVDRIAQAKKINDLLVPIDDALVILAGDLNSQPSSDPMNVLSKHWLDTADQAGSPQPTYPNVKPDRRIDYVLVRREDSWQVVKAEVVEGLIASDHCPLLVVLERHNPPKRMLFLPFFCE
ncbi:MAG: endonuclease/exonuclease/phosphatase family protein [Planctomycetes bacterium]|nr:endonuclease/exonuclease/phosphatase family protein [Planctomycetota bacterium]